MTSHPHQGGHSNNNNYTYAQGGASHASNSSATSSPRPSTMRPRYHQSASAAGSGHHHQHFTADMRDLQSRGRDPYAASGDPTSINPHRYHGGSPEGAAGVPYAVRERARHAKQVLDQPELLMMMAQKEEDSIPATRLRYLRMSCCLPERPLANLDTQARSKGGGNNSGGGSSSSGHHSDIRGGGTSNRRLDPQHERQSRQAW
ncbi:hypothetical protein Micbo1qcDRAFT_155186 [Microdochium bolleyi]|uniref:Uncharacterized protein n=1 Tax=Microdochium bolleyi TaxID=196109 RepID=A0A136JHH4_9PEZI|nr:hypothetical protein Micbo1qcDRAFT_155186 [Microdochium bolleyi]